MKMDDGFYNVGDISINEAIERCVKVYGIEGTEDTIKRVYIHQDSKRLRELFLNALHKKYKIGEQA